MSREAISRSARAALRASLALLILALGIVAFHAASGEVAPPSFRAHLERGPIVAPGALHRSTELLAQRGNSLIVAATPLLERAPAVPTQVRHPAGAPVGARSFHARDPIQSTEIVVICWQRHVPRMDSGDPPRSAPFAS